MEFIDFPLEIDKTGHFARSGGAETSLLHALKIQLTTPAAGWPGSPGFGLRDLLAELPFKAQARAEIIRRMNENLRDLGVDWAEVKSFEIDPASRTDEPQYVFSIAYRDKGTEIQWLKLT
jgi:hypothetical protein